MRAVLLRAVRTRCPPDLRPQAEERVASAPDLALEIRDCLERLPESRQLPVILHLQGLRHVEVARALGSTEKRVENLVYRGLEQLRRCLEGKGQVPG